MNILGIETSCDETGIAIYNKYKGLLANQVYSQKKIHSNYGGVVPELASRNHAKKIISLIKLVFKKSQLKITDINGIAYTAGPGLIGSLLVGATIGKTLAYSWNIPSIAINHMEGHLLSPMLEKKKPIFPFLALLISGGHTQLIKAIKFGKYNILGETLDDAVGEAFDKVAKLLDLDYPGGSKLSNLALLGIPGKYNFPRPMINKPGFSFSFSGLKTFTSKIITNSPKNNQNYADIARAFEDSVIDTLIIKCQKAIKFTGLKRLIIAGGVSSNKLLRNKIKKMVNTLGGEVFYARPEFCTDNGAMIAYVGMIRLKFGTKSNLEISVNPRWSIENLSVIDY